MVLNFVVTIINRDRREILEEVLRGLKLPLVMTMLGRGTATTEQLSLYGLVPTEKAVVTTVADGETTRRLIKAAKMRMFIDIPGNGILMSVPIKSVGGGRTMAYLTDNKAAHGEKMKMEFSHELIYVILNEGYSDMVMAAARPAGATGGTVLAGKGTGARENEKFLGISLANEKDVVLILAEAKKKAAIMKAINEQAGPKSKAAAICFSLPVTSVAGLRQLETAEEDAMPDE